MAMTSNVGSSAHLQRARILLNSCSSYVHHSWHNHSMDASAPSPSFNSESDNPVFEQTGFTVCPIAAVIAATMCPQPVMSYYLCLCSFDRLQRVDLLAILVESHPRWWSPVSSAFSGANPSITQLHITNSHILGSYRTILP